MVPGWNAVDQSICLQVATVYCQLVAGESALQKCAALVA